MAQVTVQVDRDHLERLIKSPQAGLAELIWNAVDADATTVKVTVETGDLGAIEAVVVADDGTGMTAEDARKGFGALGGSWKASEKVSRRDRRALHGAEGKGRFGAFAIGDRVRWTSVAGGDSGRVETVVTGHSFRAGHLRHLGPAIHRRRHGDRRSSRASHREGRTGAR